MGQTYRAEMLEKYVLRVLGANFFFRKLHVLYNKKENIDLKEEKGGKFFF